MCGIAGVIDLQGETPGHNILERMGNVIAHRGPDSCGVYSAPGIGFSHRRLSIIDLSSNGHQPMSNEDGTIWLVYNGEIYNYQEVRKDLVNRGHQFKSNTDTETIIHAYEEYGTQSLDRFNGMFAFALWDNNKQLLLAARDRIGIKPFYYYFNGNIFIFGSEIKAILCHPEVSREVNFDAVRQYLIYGHSYDDKTWYKNIRQLPPGFILQLENGELTTRKYWDMNFNVDYNRSFQSFEEELRAIVIDALRLNLRSDVPVGAYLSGGVDSSTIVALAAKELKNGIHTFSAAYEGKAYDERKYINIVSREFNTSHHEVTPSYIDVPQLLTRLLWHLDEPVVGAAGLPMYRVAEMVASTGVKVVNGGQGADELFGGYPPFFVLAARNLLDGVRGKGAHGPIEELLRIPQYLSKGGAFKRLWNRRNLSDPTWIKGIKDIHDARIEGMKIITKNNLYLQPFEFSSYLSVKHYLPGLLQVEDRMSMAWSIESRVPLLDYRIVELAGKIPSWMKVRKGISKYILREAVRGITPNAILDRKDKKGFPVPTGSWFAKELKEFLIKTLVETPMLSSEVIDQSAVIEMISAHESGKQDFSAQLWLILNTELWFRGVATNWQEAGGIH